MERLKIKYHDEKLERLVCNKKGDWIDLRASKTINLKAGESAIIPLGVSIELPDGYEALLCPRSSTFKNWGIIQTNSTGIIDETYCGDNDIWGMPVYATRDTTIQFNDRIAQFRIIEHQPKLEFVEVENLGNNDRGGFGSTGKE